MRTEVRRSTSTRDGAARDLDAGGSSTSRTTTGVRHRARPVAPAGARGRRAGVFGVQTLDDGAALRDDLDAARPQRAVVVGGGYIGVEMAEASGARARGDGRRPRRQPMSHARPGHGRAWCDAAMRDLGIESRTETAVEGFETGPDGRVRAVVTASEGSRRTSSCWARGRPNARWPARPGCRRRVRRDPVDASMRARPRGGVGRWRLRRGRAPGVRSGTCRSARTRTSRAGSSGTTSAAATRRSPGSSARRSPRCATSRSRAPGCGEGGRAAGFAFVTVTVDSTTAPATSPATEPDRQADRRAATGRLLGAQIVGREGSAKRIDVLAVALWNG